jgi:hypothetical protein
MLPSLLTKVLHCLAQLLEESSVWCPPISACSVAGIELVRDSGNVVRSVPMRSDAMLIPYFYKRGDLIAKDGDKDKQKNDTVLQNIALVNAVCLQILEILLNQEELINCIVGVAIDKNLPAKVSSGS